MGSFDVKSLVGLTEEAARAKAGEHNFRFRVLGRDGKVFAGTMDYRLDRVNVYVDKGIVTSARLG